MYIYLASPYTDAELIQRKRRYDETCRFTAEHMRNGVILFSPIVHCHTIAMDHNLPHDFEFWRRWCLNMLANAAEMWVLKLPGWKESRGVAAEMSLWINDLQRTASFHEPV